MCSNAIAVCLLVILGGAALLAQGVTVIPLGTSAVYPYYILGSGEQYVIGVFEIENSGTTGRVVHQVEIAAVGSGDDSSAFSEVSLYTDANNSLSFDPNSDAKYGQQYAAYPSDDGVLTFSASIGIPAGGRTRFFIVARFNLAAVGAKVGSFFSIVQSVTATGGTPTGVPSAMIPGVWSDAQTAPLRLEYNVTGSAPPYNYSFRLLLDNHNGSWASGHGWAGIVFGQAAWPSLGLTPFSTWTTNSGSYPVGPFDSTQWVTFVYGTVPYSSWYLDNSAAGTAYWTPAAVGEQLTWFGTNDVYLQQGEMTWSTLNRTGIGANNVLLEPAYRVGDYIRVVAVPAAVVRPGPLETGSGNGFLMSAFDVVAHSNAATFSGLTLAALGTGDDSSAFSEVRLYVDGNGNGAFDPGVDTPFGATYTAFGADDGSLTFNDTLSLGVNETKRLLVVCKLNGATPATYGQTFAARVTAINATGQNHSGLPTAAVSGIAIHAPAISVTSTGAALSAFANGVGPGGLGLSVADFVLASNNVGAASLGSITVAAAGSLFDHTAFSLVALYEDSNASGTFDAADMLYGTAASAFPADDGSLTFTGAMIFAPSQSRRLFLVVKLNGSASVGDDFWARVNALGLSGGTEADGLGALVHGMTIVPGSDPNGPGGGSGGGGNGNDGGSGCAATAATLLPLPLLLVFARRRARRAKAVRN